MPQRTLKNLQTSWKIRPGKFSNFEKKSKPRQPRQLQEKSDFFFIAETFVSLNFSIFNLDVGSMPRRFFDRHWKNDALTIVKNSQDALKI